MFKNIQMLRAVAAAMVLLYHAVPHYQAMGGASLLFIKAASTGFAGVDIFFVISGFVAAHSTLDKARTVSNAWVFAKRRLLRIYLGYWPFFGLTLALTGVYAPRALDEMDLISSFFLTRIELKSLLLFVTWSLSFELLFYALVAASFALPVRVVKALVHVGAAGTLFLLIWTYGNPDSAGLFLSMLLEFLAGVVVYIHREWLKSRWWIIPCVLSAVIAFAMGVRLLATDGPMRIFTFGAGALALVMLALTLEQSRSAIANRIWVASGDASYTLYLAHLSLLMLFYFWGIRDFLAGQAAFLREMGFFLYLGLCLWIAHIHYVRVEGPLYRWASSSSNFGRSGRQMAAESRA